MIRRILCPTNLKASSQDSVAYALRLANENNAELTIFHATSFPALHHYTCEIDDYFQWQQLACAFRLEHLLGDAERKVRHFVTARFVNESSEVEWKIKVALGNAAEEITFAAFQEEADLVVMGRSKPKLSHLFTRNIAETVVSKVACPVLLIDTTEFVSNFRGWRLAKFRALFQNS